MSVFIHPQGRYIEFRTPAALPFSHVEQARQSLGYFLEQYAVPCERLQPVTLDAAHADRVAFAVRILTALHPCPAQMAAGCRSLAEPPADDETEGCWIAPDGCLALRVGWDGFEELETALAGLFEMLEKHAVSSNASERTAAGLVWLIRWLLPTAADFAGLELAHLSAVDRQISEGMAERCRAEFADRLQAAEGLAALAGTGGNAAFERFFNGLTFRDRAAFKEWLQKGHFPDAPSEDAEGEAAADHETKSPPTAANGDGLQRGF